MGRHDVAQRIRRFTNDRTSGAAELAREAAAIIDRAAGARYSSHRLQQLRARLARAHPTMGAVWNTVYADDPIAYLLGVEQARRRATRAVRGRLPRGARVLTLSYSSSVARALDRHDLRVTAAESRPGDDGRHLLRRRRQSGLTTELIPDAALGIAVRDADCALIGADAINRRFVVNKVGSFLLALACRGAGVPLYVVADPSKLVPADWPAPAYSRRRPFEAVPRRLVSEVFDGVESPG